MECPAAGLGSAIVRTHPAPGPTPPQPSIPALSCSAFHKTLLKERFYCFWGEDSIPQNQGSFFTFLEQTLAGHNGWGRGMNQWPRVHPVHQFYLLRSEETGPSASSVLAPKWVIPPAMNQDTGK